VTLRRRTIFLGTGPFALPVLEAVAAAPVVELVAVVTAPPRPAGRGQSVHVSPVATRAMALGWPVLSPLRLRAPESVAAIRALRPDLLVLADYGQIVPPELLALPAHGALNLHPSLLPRHRGASPIAAAILAGDAETGVTLMRMDEGLDSGPIVAQRRVPLAGHEVAPELEALLAVVAAELLTASLADWLAGRVPATPQGDIGMTMTRPLQRGDGRLDPDRTAVELERQVRGYQPWPGTYAETEAGRLLIWRAEALDGGADLPRGTIVVDGDGLAIAVSGGRLRLVEVQPADGRRMDGAALRRGRPALAGSRIGGATLG
jgi:methionyl-tRNA formyltransferase